MWRGTPEQFAHQLGVMNTAVTQGASARACIDGSLLIQRGVMAITPRRLSGVRGGTGQGQLGVRFSVSLAPTGAESVIRATGPFQLYERDTTPHRIPTLAEDDTNEADKVAAFDGEVYSNVYHPGTTGKHPFERVVNASTPAVAVAGSRAVETTIQKVF